MTFFKKWSPFTIVFGILAVHGAVATGFPGPTPLGPPPLVDSIAEVDRSLVFISVGDSSGSGFLYGSPAMVVTNRHVVDGVGIDGEVTIRALEVARDGRVRLGKELAGVVRVMHPTQDLAVVEISSPLPGTCRSIRVPGESSLVPRGSQVLVHGFPATQVPLVSRGIVSGHHHDFADDVPLYVLDAASGSGSSGGPVTDVDGRLVAVCSAVYDVPEDLGSTWGFAIPASEVRRMFDDRGRLRIPDRARTVGELVAEVRRSSVGRGRIDSMRTGMNVILSSRTGLRTLTRDLAEFFERSSGYITIREKEDGRRFMEILLELMMSGARRGVELGLGGDEALDDPAFALEVEQHQSRSELTGQKIFQRAMSELEEAELLSVVAGMLDAISSKANSTAETIPAAIRQLEAFASGDIQTLRGTDRTKVVESMASIAFAQVVIELGETMPRVSAAERRSLPRAVGASLDRFESTMTRLRGQYLDLPPSVASLFEEEEPGMADADAVRMHLGREGFTLIAPQTRVFDLGTEGFSWGFEVRSDWNWSAVAVLAESMNGGDIDLILMDPDGEITKIDEAIDGFPVTLEVRPRPGRWTARLVNAAGRTTTVRVEIWADR